MKTSIITTTINIPRFLESYIPNLEKYGHLHEVDIIIVGDTKTPKEAKQYVHDLIGERDIHVEMWDVIDQEEWINNNYPDMKEDIAFAIPYQSVRRRNFGYLRALQLCSDVIITIDDDNLPTDEDWLSGHLKAFEQNGVVFNEVFSQNKFVNPCEMLNMNHEGIYMRGYPISEIYSDSFALNVLPPTYEKVVLNMGLWNLKPDVDSYTNIIFPDLQSNELKAEYPRKLAVAKGNYIFINTQNTAISREAMPAYYLLFQDTRIYENKIDRFDDIWSGIILQKIAFAMNHTVTFGSPCANHMRNTHDFAKDLKCEFSGIVLNDKIIRYIIDMPLECSSYREGYEKIIEHLEKIQPNAFHEPVHMFLSRMTRAMRIWLKLIDKWM
jgi:hypothetical protein